MFSSRIKELRKRKNISQKEMADALNVAQSLDIYTDIRQQREKHISDEIKSIDIG